MERQVTELDTWAPEKKGGELGKSKGQTPRCPYHFLLQLLCSVVLEDDQPMLKGDDHKGRKCYSLIISYQAPLVKWGRKEDVNQKQGRAGRSSHVGSSVQPPSPEPAWPCV